MSSASAATGALPGNAPALPEDGLAAVLYSTGTSVAYVFPLLVGTLMVTAEFRHKTLTPTFLATPRRGRVLVAKLAVGVFIGVILGVVGVVAAVGTSAAFLAGFGLSRINARAKHEVEQASAYVSYALLVPIFFVSIGLVTDFAQLGLAALPYAGLLILALGLGGLDDLGGDVLSGRLALGDLAMRGDAAVVRARKRRVRAALAGRKERDATAGELLLLAAEGRVGLGARELGLGLDVDLPAGQPRSETGVQPLLADGERELVVGYDHGRLAGLVVDEHLAHARGRERLGDEASRLRVPRDDVDLLAAELGHDHADARPSRADARADWVDALDVGLDRDLRAVPGLAGDAADLDQAVRDLGNLELEERLDQLGIAAGKDDLWALRPGTDFGDDGLDAAALLVALAVHLLGARQEGLDLAEIDEHVVAVARLLDDAGHDLAHAVDVLVVRATVPGVLRAEKALASRPARVVAVVAATKWPPSVRACLGPRLRMIDTDGRVVFFPSESQLAINGLSAEPLPTSTRRAASRLLDVLEIGGAGSEKDGAGA